MAFSTGRVLTLDPEFFGLNQHFKPLSLKCPFNPKLKPKHVWPKDISPDIVKIPQLDNTVIPLKLQKGQSPYLPKDLIDVLPLITPDPETWFDGQFIAYALRPNSAYKDQFELKQNSSYQASVHVRRSDKIKEVYFTDISDYVKVIQDYFSIRRAKNLDLDQKKTIFVATDDPSAIAKIQKSLENQDILVDGNVTIADNASEIFNRFIPEVHDALVQDFFKLANADFLLCTFSSNLGRLAYEYRSATRPTNSDLYEVFSLDLNPFGDYSRRYTANHDRIIDDNEDILELEFKKNDIILVPKNHQRHFGYLQRSKSDLRKHFLRSGVSRIHSVSDDFPPILIN